jgi:uncharacterized protein (TIGR03066 family)
MNMLRLALVGTLVLGLMAAARADEEKGGKPDIQKKLVGKWEVVKFAGKEGAPPARATVEFTKDGKIITTAENKGEKLHWEGTYKVEGKRLTITRRRGNMEQTQKLEVVKVDDKELVVTRSPEEGVTSLKRKEP